MPRLQETPLHISSLNKITLNNLFILYIIAISAILTSLGQHSSLTELDSYIYLSAAKELYIPELGLGRTVFIKFLSLIVFSSKPLIEILNTTPQTILQYVSHITAISTLLLISWCYYRSTNDRAETVLVISIMSMLPAFGYYSYEILSETYLLILLAIAITGTLRNDFSIWTTITLGLIAGISIHVRETLILYFPLIIFLLYIKKRFSKKSVLTMAFSAIVIQPLILRFSNFYDKSFIDDVQLALNYTLSINSFFFFILACIFIAVFAIRNITILRDKYQLQTCTTLILIPDLMIFSLGTSPIRGDIRYFPVTTIVVSILVARLLKRTHDKYRINNKVKTSGLYILLGIILISTSIISSNHYTARSLQAKKSLQELKEIKPNMKTLILGFEGIKLRSLTNQEDKCFNIIASGWSWPKFQLANKLLSELKLGFDIVINKTILSDHQRNEVSRAITEIRNVTDIQASDNDNFLTLRRKSSLKLSNSISSLKRHFNCWE